MTYRVRTRSERYPVREFTQRVAVVSRADVAGKPGFWVELKTVDPAHGTRIERGLFAAAPPDEEGDSLGSAGNDAGAPTGDEAGGSGPLRLVRYQVLMPGGKLYEYPVQAAASPRAEGLVSSYELFEYDPSVKPERSFLGPDTLRIGRRVVPAVLERTVRIGTDDWPSFEDSATVYRLKMTQVLWRNAAVPITGIARSLFRVTTVKMAEHPDSVHAGNFVPPDSTMGAVPGVAAAGAATADSAGAVRPPADVPHAGLAPADTSLDGSVTHGEGRVLAWTELVLEDLGADATPEVTQTPEPAPSEEPKPTGFVR